MQKKEWKDIKVGDEIVSSAHVRAKILEVFPSGNTFLASKWLDYKQSGAIYLVTEAIADRFTLEGEVEAWEPKMREDYWHIFDTGVGRSVWDNDCTDRMRRDCLGIYPTKELAQAAFEKCKKAVRE